MKKVILFFLLFFSTLAFGQSEDEKDNSVDEIEGLFKEEAESNERRERFQRSQQQRGKEVVPKDISDLKSLETFKDIAIIQKRYLPKTGRFEFYAAGGTNLNDAFFFGNGISFRLGYNFREKWAIEAMYSYIQNSPRAVTNELLQLGVTTEGSLSTDNYMGIDLKWTPIYGKYAYLNEKIIPFDLYFTLGAGKTSPKFVSSSEENSTTLSTVNSPYTLRFGTGQIFAINKWMAFRWDLANHFIYSEVNKDGEEAKDQWNNNLFLSIGLSFFFPEAKYR